MVDTSKKLAQIEEYIEEGLYFTINRARQFGKTTTMKALFRNLSDRYVVISISFEIGDTIFDSVEGFCEGLDFKIANAAGMSTEQINFWQNEHKSSSFEGLSYKISAFCKSQSKPVLLLIDEVDKSTDNQLFLNFLGLLRNKFLDRDMKGMNSTFHSVVLAGVYDVKNLKLKLRPDEER
jgi:AAA+ ATPase superfamily predicted ATPase